MHVATPSRCRLKTSERKMRPLRGGIILMPQKESDT